MVKALAEMADDVLLDNGSKVGVKLMTEARRKIYECDAKTIAYYRRNPVIACEDLLGIKLTDSQKWILTESWNKPHCIWCCCRDFGKSFIGVIFMVLKAMLFENQAIYIISSVGDQAKETFTKLEEIVLRVGKTTASIETLKDIAANETVKNPTNKTGFSHDPASYSVEFYNGSAIYTLNSHPDRVRSRRATLVFFDEAAFCSDELIAACEAFAAQDSNFVTSTENNYAPLIKPRRCPTQLIYASSQDDESKLFYKRYREFSKKMISGNRDYFVCDMVCDTAIKTFMDGKPYYPLLTQEKVDAALSINREKAMREYFNQPTRDGGENQIIKWGEVRNNERFTLPVLKLTDDSQSFALAFDPARISDNSIVSTMELVHDPELGLCGKIVNCTNFVDTSNSRKVKLDSSRQVDILREMLVQYNGIDYPDYVHLDMLLVDAGSGGGGVSAYADALLADFVDKRGAKHRGLLDRTYDLYRGYEERYPNAVDNIRLINPKRYRTQMVEETIELIKDGVLWFPYEYGNSDYVKVKYTDEEGTEQFKVHEVTDEERLALQNIELMKTELTSIHRYQAKDKTNSTYALAPDKIATMHDDRFYTLIMLGHRLYELRRKTKIVQKDEEMPILKTYSCVSSVDF